MLSLRQYQYPAGAEACDWRLQSRDEESFRFFATATILTALVVVF